ncbi:MAG: pectate lyase, partial [Phycisphaerales bacterium]|nr:pectate lyase [Phycisphaerales bacterium]
MISAGFSARYSIIAAIGFVFASGALAVAKTASQPSLPAMKPSAATRAAGSQGGPRQYLDKPAAWYGSDEAKAVAAIVLTHQAALGGWPKNIDTTAKPSTQSADQIHGTFDNNATFDEMRLLAKIYDATHDEQYKKAVERGMDLIFISQYPTGGWPQSYPPDKSYH